jgi:hypothetical protein
LAPMGRTEDQEHGKPMGEPIVGPDDVPVVVRLRGPSRMKLNWDAVLLPDGILVGLGAAVLLGLARTVSAVVRRVRRKPRYRVSIEVGGPEPRSLMLGFDSQARAEDCARDLIDAVRRHGVAAVPPPGKQ